MAFTRDTTPTGTVLTVDSGAVAVGKPGAFDPEGFDPVAFETGDTVQFYTDAGPITVTITPTL